MHGSNYHFPPYVNLRIPHNADGAFYGPEDPGIVIEQGTPDAEPIIIFNIVEDPQTTVRSMHLFRPFSDFTTKVYVEHDPPSLKEKNWSPFFLPSTFNDTSAKRYQNRYLHFIYDYHPLRILRCHVLNSACSWAYQQVILEAYAKEHNFKNSPDVMRGGTNFIRVDIQNRPGLISFVWFPRTHCEEGCGLEAMYRPELMVLTTNGMQFWIDYLSGPLSFDHSVLTENQREDACDTGRIMLANSITRFDEKNSWGVRTDTVTVSFTVADSTVQIATVKGVRALVHALPQFDLARWRNSDVQWSLDVTHNVILCSVRSATDFSYENTTPAQLDNVRKKKEADQAKYKEEEEKKKKLPLEAGKRDVERERKEIDAV